MKTSKRTPAHEIAIHIGLVFLFAGACAMVIELLVGGFGEAFNAVF